MTDKEKRREEARKEVVQRTFSGPFTYDDIEEIMNDYGFEMDGIEDFF